MHGGHGRGTLSRREEATISMMPAISEQLCLKKSDSWKMFDRIAQRYDLLTHIFSFGLDLRWRRRLTHFLPRQTNQRLLDVATGTATTLIILTQQNSNIRQAYGIDLSEQMMDVARRKIKRLGLEERIILQRGDALEIPFSENEFDAVTMAFGIRNVTKSQEALTQILRVLKEQGRALILEFSWPRNKFIKSITRFYMTRIIPFLGNLILRDEQAYRYLHQSIAGFLYGDDFCHLMRDVGFQNVKANELFFGVATIYQGDKC